MTERAARRPSVSQSVLRIAAVAMTAVVLLWSALFYSAVRRHAAVVSPTAQVAPGLGTQQPTPAATPVTTRTS